MKKLFESFETNLVNVSFAKSTWAVLCYSVFNVIFEDLN